jgi:ribonucleoside-diphosphate reductase alpha chain
VCAYLETWHLDIEEFLELRKNTGDDRRRTHDMNTANWVPDLFMQRVIEDAEWTLFTPSDVPDLHDLTGNAFVERYTHYETLPKNSTCYTRKFVPKICGAKCYQCCLKQVIRGLLSKTFVTYVHHNNTLA